MPIEAPEAPEFLSEKAQKAWVHVVDTLRVMNIMTRADVVAVSLLCEAYAEWMECSEVLARDGMFISTGDQGMVRAHPALGQRDSANNKVRAWLTEYGMTAAARSKIRVAQPEQKDDPLAAYV